MQSWLDVEVALAEAQADLGVIPREAADRIARAARLDVLDIGRIRADMIKTGHPLVPHPGTVGGDHQRATAGPARMRSNLGLSGHLIVAEAVMMKLAEAIGRQHAHEVVYEAAQAAINDRTSFRSRLLADPRVTSHLTAQQIGSLLDPAAYMGLSAEIATDAANRARKSSGPR